MEKLPYRGRGGKYQWEEGGSKSRLVYQLRKDEVSEIAIFGYIYITARPLNSNTDIDKVYRLLRSTGRSTGGS